MTMKVKLQTEKKKVVLQTDPHIYPIGVCVINSVNKKNIGL